MTLCDVTLLARGFVEDVATMFGGVGRSVKMQADCSFGHAWVLDPVQAQAIAHVSHLVWLVGCAPSDLKSCWLKVAAECVLANVTSDVIWMLVLTTWKSMCDRYLDTETPELLRRLMRCRRADMARRRAFR